jgi:aminoglycoside 6'-N-acetyltransferase
MAATRDSRLTFRPATLADVALLRHWDTQPHVRAGVPAGCWDWEEELGAATAGQEPLIAELDGRPVGFVQIMNPAQDESRYWGDAPPGMRAIDIWVGEAADTGRGLGTRMMRLALDRCFADPSVHAVLLDPLAGNRRAHRFYERLGFRFVEHRRFGDDDCFVYRLERSAWQ